MHKYKVIIAFINIMIMYFILVIPPTTDSTTPDGSSYYGQYNYTFPLTTGTSHVIITTIATVIAAIKVVLLFGICAYKLSR